MEEICLSPIGIVKNGVNDINAMPVGGERSIVEVKKNYAPALQRIEENSHVWIICWFDRADRGVLQVMPPVMEPESLKFGVFGVRFYSRPNPVALTLVALEKVEGNRIYVTGLDAVNGTPVIDIKPYYEQDSIFSPRTSYIRPRKEQARRRLMHKLAYRHHGEESVALEIGLRICLAAEDYLGHLLDPALYIAVKGSRELADVIQGITRARLANPARFTFSEGGADEVDFARDGKSLKFSVLKKFSREELNGLEEDELFLITKDAFDVKNKTEQLEK